MSEEAIREIHISDAKSFRSCRVRWHFSSMLREGREMDIPNRHLWLGSGVHEGLAGYYTAPQLGAKAALDAFMSWARQSARRLKKTEGMEREHWLEVGEGVRLARGMLTHYAQWAPSHDDFEVLQPEVIIRVPLPEFGEGAQFAGRADGLALDVHGDYWLLEHKTAQTFPDIEALGVDEQAIAYNWAAREDPRLQQYKIKGTLFTFLRKKLPKKPKRLKDGSLSKSLVIDTTYETYLQTLLDAGLSTTLYGSILQHLRDKGNTFFLRVPVTPSQGMLDTFGRYIRVVAKQMLDPNVDIYPNDNWWCGARCAYRDPCRAVKNGLDPTALLKYGFRKRTFHPFDLLPEEAR